MNRDAKIGIVTYFNSLPYEWSLMSFLNKSGSKHISIVKLTPSLLASAFVSQQYDMALLPVAAVSMEAINPSFALQQFGIACDGKVDTVCLFSCSPLSEVEYIYLDHESQTSNLLMRVLTHRFLKREIVFNCISKHPSLLKKGEGCVAIGDKAFSYQATYVYDLGELWKQFTGLPFVFAIWTAASNRHIEMAECIASHFQQDMPYLQERVQQATDMPAFKKAYLLHTIHYNLTTSMFEALRLFKQWSAEVPLLHG